MFRGHFHYAQRSSQLYLGHLKCARAFLPTPLSQSVLPFRRHTSTLQDQHNEASSRPSVPNFPLFHRASGSSAPTDETAARAQQSSSKTTSNPAPLSKRQKRLAKQEKKKKAAAAKNAASENAKNKSDDTETPRPEGFVAKPPNPKPKAKKDANKNDSPSVTMVPSIAKGIVNETSVEYDALDIEREEVPTLAYGLDRVLFNPGVYFLQDPRSLVYNFDPYLGSIMPISEFDFDALNEYITSSRDTKLWQAAQKLGKKYIGSSSSMTGVMSQFHFLLSNWRPVNTSLLSQGFPATLNTFTKLSRAPSAAFLRYKDGVYAIDADKEFDTANVLLNLGKSMEKLLTVPTHEFEKYRKSSVEKVDTSKVPPEAYHYSSCGDFLMRSQLDAYDPRLPGSGMFDLKTRAVVSIRMDAANYENGLGYQIKDRFGEFESFEREFFDMIRSAFLKYSLQVRMGRMDGIFVAYHNVQRIFGFQYLGLHELDQTLHGQYDTALGDREFRLSLGLWNKILDVATEHFPKQTLRLHFETRQTQSPFMYIFAEPMSNEEANGIQSKNREEIEAFQRKLLFPELYENGGEGIDKKAQVSPEEVSHRARAALTEIMTEKAAREEQSLQEESSEKEEEDARELEVSSEELNQETTEIASGEVTDAPHNPVDEASTTEQEQKSTSPDTTTTAQETQETQEPTDSASTSASAPAEDQGEAPPARPILALCLNIRNKVNNKYVGRPNKFKSTDNWAVEYDLRVFKDPKRAHDLYELCKRRRAKELAAKREEGTESKFNRAYTARLKRLSQQGSAWRAEIDKREQEGGVVMYK